MKTNITNWKTISGVCFLILLVLLNFGCSTDELIFHSPSTNVYILYYQPWFSGTHIFFCKDSISNSDKDYLLVGNGVNKSLVVHFDQETEDVVFNSSLTTEMTEDGFSRKPHNDNAIYLQGCIHNIDVIRNSVFDFTMFNPGVLPYRFPDYLPRAPFQSDAFHKESLTLYDYVKDGCIKEMEPLERKHISLLRWIILKHKL
jgi:hypothetical protein